MPKRRGEVESRSVELLERLVLLELHALGVSQERIARFLGKQKAWVNRCLKGIPKPRKES
jgi:hypothetical protein